MKKLLLILFIPFLWMAPVKAECTCLVYLPVVTSPQALQPIGPNLLANPSFESGWYHPNGVPELQIPNQWQFSWAKGPTGFGDEPWDVWVRPEVRVLPADQLPPHEHDLFIWDGEQTLKIFKGYGAISFTMQTEVSLQPGTYQFVINFFPDLVDHYDNGQKVWAPDPTSGEVAFIVGNEQTDWNLPTFGVQETYTHTFTIEQAQTIDVGVAMRGRYALLNNGWFMDDWSLHKMEGQ